MKKTISLIIIILLSVLIFIVFKYHTTDLNILATQQNEKKSIESYAYNQIENGMELSFDKFSGVLTLCEINLEDSTPFTISCTSDINCKDGYIFVLDSNYNIISRFNINETVSNTITPDTNTYILRLVCNKGHNGKAKFTISSSGKFKINIKSFFEK